MIRNKECYLLLKQVMAKHRKIMFLIYAIFPSYHVTIAVWGTDVWIYIKIGCYYVVC